MRADADARQADHEAEMQVHAARIRAAEA
jgi:hypothetical protein